MKIFSVLLVLVYLSGTGRDPRAITGTWKVKNYALWEKGAAFLNGVNRFVYGHELTLNPDSTYREQSCGNFYAGRWTLNNDSLILRCDTMWYRQNYSPSAGIASSMQSIFLVKKGKLVRYLYGEPVARGTKQEKFKRRAMIILK
jgi:hypothetical protein